MNKYYLLTNLLYIDFTCIAASNTVTDDVKNGSHIEYLIQSYNILVLILYSKFKKWRF